jgi:hypothetical protein
LNKCWLAWFPPISVDCPRIGLFPTHFSPIGLIITIRYVYISFLLCSFRWSALRRHGYHHSIVRRNFWSQYGESLFFFLWSGHFSRGFFSSSSFCFSCQRLNPHEWAQ